MPSPIIAYKGFDKDLKCRGFQFEVGKTYRHEGPVEPCESGFHACTDPFDVWFYYSPADSRFAEVELRGETKTHGQDSKVAAAEIAIKAELTLPRFIERAVKRTIELTDGKGDDPGRDDAQIGSSGYHARIGSSGDYARIGSSGYHAQIGSVGYHARIGSSGDYARIGSSGDYAQIGSSGNHAQIGSSGNCARIAATGANAVVASAGHETRIMGAIGTWVSLAEYRDDECVGFATGCIGRDGLEPDVWYVARGGKLVKESA